MWKGDVTMKLLRREVDAVNKIHNYITASKEFTLDFTFNEMSPNQAIERSKNFAYAMTFGGRGHHRAVRSGGNHVRMNGEIFLNTFNGKLGEFAVHEYITRLGYKVSDVDLSIAGEGVWDNGDFIVEGVNISVKTIKDYSQLLLLERTDWNQVGQYIPDLNNPEARQVDLHILVKLKGNTDLEKELKKKRKFFSELTLEEIDKLLKDYQVHADVVGFATTEMLQEAIRDAQLVYQGEFLGKGTPIQADNYYIQAGDLLPMPQLTELLAERVR